MALPSGVEVQRVASGDTIAALWLYRARTPPKSSHSADPIGQQSQRADAVEFSDPAASTDQAELPGIAAAMILKAMPPELVDRPELGELARRRRPTRPPGSGPAVRS